MDFRNDLRKIAKQFLDHYGVDSFRAKTDEDFIQMWMNVCLKLIPQQKYQVFRSNTLTSKSLSQEIRDGIDSVQEKLEQGVDVTPHMTKTVLKGSFTDYLLSDWGIYHLHLGLSIFVKTIMDFCYLISTQGHLYGCNIYNYTCIHLYLPSLSSQAGGRSLSTTGNITLNIVPTPCSLSTAICPS